MPSGPKKRKAAKKKKFQDSNNSISSSTTHSHHGESTGGELNSPKAQDHHHNNQLPFLEMEKHEEGLSQNGSLKVKSTEKAANEQEGKIGIIDKRSKIGGVNESETLQYSDKQPLIAMQTTSWKGCCGILDLLSSSDR